MASVGHQRVGSPPLGPRTCVTKAKRPHQAGLPPTWNPTCLRQQRPTSLCSLPTPSLLGEVKNQQPPALLKFAKIQLPEVGSPLFGNWNLLQFPSIFMATAGHPQVGSSPLGRRTYVARASKATPSRITSCLEPNLLKTAEAHNPVVTAWQCRWATCGLQVASPLCGNPASWREVRPNNLQFCWSCKNPKLPEVGSPLLGSRNSLKNSSQIHGKCWAPKRRIAPTWTPKLCHESKCGHTK